MDGFTQGDDHLLIVGDVLRGKHAPFSVLQPLLADLVASDVQVPYGFGYTTKAGRPGGTPVPLLRRAGVEPDGVLRPTNAANLEALMRIDRGGNELVESG